MSLDSRETQKNLKEDFKGRIRNIKVDLRWQLKLKECRKEKLLRTSKAISEKAT